MNVFLTGASGFIGANIARKLLEKKYSVHVLNRTDSPSWRLKDIANQIVAHKGDIADLQSVTQAVLKAQPSYIIHLATYGAYSYQKELEKIINVNVVGTANLLEATKDIPYRCFINTGSSSEYGLKSKPMKETDFCDPVSYYAASKLAATNLCKVFAKINNKPIVTLRLFSVYGPYEEPSRFIPAIIKALKYKEAVKLTPGKQRRDFIYIDDVVEAYLQTLRAGRKLKEKICNIGTGQEFTNDEIVNRLFNVTKQKTIIQKGAYPKRDWDTLHWRADISRAKKLLSWKPRYTIDKGLQSAYSWFENNEKLFS